MAASDFRAIAVVTLLLNSPSFSAQLTDAQPIHRINSYYAVTRPCRFSPWTRTPGEFDYVMRPLHAVIMVESDPNTQLPLVIATANHRKIPGFIDRRCLDPGPLQDFEYQGQYQDQNPFEAIRLWPTLQGVIRSKSDPLLLAHDPAPLTPKALDKVRQLQENSQKLLVDMDAILEISGKDTATSISENLFAFLTSSSIELGDLIHFSSLEATLNQERMKQLSKIGGEALIMSFAEFRNASKPSCSRIKSGVRLFFASGLQITSADQVLAAYSLAHGFDARSNKICPLELTEAQLLLDQLYLPKPVSPYYEDQAWKRIWGIATDETIAKAFPGQKVRIIRDDGDLSSEKRVIAQIPGWGTLEEYKVSNSTEYRWIELSDKKSARSTPELKKRLRKFRN
jgi:hypothetical protein